MKWDKAVAKLVKDRDALLTFHDYPAERWKHIRTSNPIESNFATVRHRTKRTKGEGDQAGRGTRLLCSTKSSKACGSGISADLSTADLGDAAR